MFRRGTADCKRAWIGRIAPAFLMLVLVVNLLAPFAFIASYPAETAGLDDSNSVVICTNGGWERIPLSEHGLESSADIAGDFCAEYCSLCVVAMAGQVVLAPEFAFSLKAADSTTRYSILSSEVIRAAVDLGFKHPRAPPAFS